MNQSKKNVMILETEYAHYFKQYINNVTAHGTRTSIIKNLENSQKEFIKFLENLPKEKHMYRYEQDKWTIKEIVQHVIDSERIFAYRALSFARKDTTVLPGFDQDFFTNNSHADTRPFKELVEEMALLRKTTIFLFKSFSDESLLRTGIMSDKKITVRALGYLFSGHQMHHLNVIKEKYLQ